MIGKLINRLKAEYFLSNENWQVRIVFFGVLAVTFVVYMVIVFTPPGGPEEERQTGVLKQFAAETQLYPGAKLIEERVVPKGSMVSLWVKYETRDDFRKVEEFYYQQLTSKAWARDQTQDSSLFSPVARNTYRKGAYEITLYPSETPRPGFQLIFKWSRP
jgi:hypothetical protein